MDLWRACALRAGACACLPACRNVWEVTGAGLTQSSNDGTEASSADFLGGIDDCAVAVAAVSPSAAAER